MVPLGAQKLWLNRTNKPLGSCFEVDHAMEKWGETKKQNNKLL
jgi:hypothetical protein